MNGSAFLSMIPMRVAISIAFMATMLPDLSVIANFSHSTKWQRSDICKYELHVNCENKLASRSFSVIEVLAQFTKASTGRHVSGFDVSVFLSLVKIENYEELEKEIKEYIEYYNNERIQKGLGYMTPKEYKEKELARISMENVEN